MNRCPQCNFENADHSRFCGGCGAALKTTAVGTQPTVPDHALQDGTPTRSPVPSTSSQTLVDGEGGGSPGSISLAGPREEYEVREEVGRGGMSVVYRVWDRKLHRAVALKRLLPEFTQRERALKRLMTE